MKLGTISVYHRPANDVNRQWEATVITEDGTTISAWASSGPDALGAVAEQLGRPEVIHRLVEWYAFGAGVDVSRAGFSPLSKEQLERAFAAWRSRR